MLSVRIVIILRARVRVYMCVLNNSWTNIPFDLFANMSIHYYNGLTKKKSIQNATDEKKIVFQRDAPLSLDLHQIVSN